MTSSLSTEILATDIDRLTRPWWTCWAAMHWGFRRYAAVYWCCHGQITSFEARTILGVDVEYSLDLIIFYREMVVTLVPEHDLAVQIVEATPKLERSHLSRFYAGNSAFAQGKGSMRAIHKLIDEVTVPAGLPRLRLTDDGPDSRVATARMVFDGLRRTHSVRSDNPPKKPGETPLMLISSDCPELISALPSLESDPKDQEDVRRILTMQDDVWAACCNAYRDYPSIVAGKPMEVLRMEAVNKSDDPTQRNINFLKFNEEFGGDQVRPRKR